MKVKKNVESYHDEKKYNDLFKDKVEKHFFNKNVRKISWIKTFFEYVKSVLTINTNYKNDYSIVETWEDFILLFLEKKVIDNFSELENLLKIIEKEIYFFKTFIDMENMNLLKSDLYYYSDFIYSLRGRKIYIPLMREIFMKIWEKGNHFTNIAFNKEIESVPNKDSIEKTRMWLFEIERSETYFQMELYEGQSLTSTINHIAKEIKNIDFLQFRSILWEKINNFNNYEEFKIGWDKIKLNRIDGFNLKPKAISLILNRLIHKNLIINWDDNGYLFPKKLTIEHIMPQNSKKAEIYVKDFNVSKNSNLSISQLHKKWLNNIGNILLLNDVSNKQMSDKEFYAKKKQYLKWFDNDSRRDFNNIISDADNWTNQEISYRAKEIIEEIVKIYEKI